jgi:16S rRNA G966 N2-methylase RsmD
LLPKTFFSDHVQNFIHSLENEEPETIVLKNRTIADLSSTFIADQVNGRKKAREKLPLYFNTPFIVYPPKLNVEQSSSEATARYKIDQIVSGITSFRNCADITGGFGVDSYFLSTRFESLAYVEPNESLVEITANNHKQLGAKNIQHINSTAEQFLASTPGPFDLIYIDPSRRVIGNQKVFSFAQSEPNVIELLSTIFEKTNMLVVKASPLLDIQLASRELRSVKRVAIIAINNDCKELLFFVEKDFVGEPLIHTVNIRSASNQVFDFSLSREQSAPVSYSDVLQYLYEPNAAIMKGGAFKSIANNFGLSKLQPNTHLYTSDKMISGFPGKIFRVIANVKPEPAELKKYFPEGKANIITRNYPLHVDDLRKKTKLTDGGERYLIAFSGTNKKLVVVAERLD